MLDFTLSDNQKVTSSSLVWATSDVSLYALKFQCVQAHSFYIFLLDGFNKKEKIGAKRGLMCAPTRAP